jgi:predicted transposase/invertase (TIGR01784 family)
MNRHDYDVVLQHSYDMGIQAGIEQGREEGRTTAILQNARKMKELGIDDETIMRVTGLDKAKVNSL